jgi:hypothetical protein
MSGGVRGAEEASSLKSTESSCFRKLTASCDLRIASSVAMAFAASALGVLIIIGSLPNGPDLGFLSRIKWPYGTGASYIATGVLVGVLAVVKLVKKRKEEAIFQQFLSTSPTAAVTPQSTGGSSESGRAERIPDYEKLSQATDEQIIALELQEINRYDQATWNMLLTRVEGIQRLTRRNLTEQPKTLGDLLEVNTVRPLGGVNIPLRNFFIQGLAPYLPVESITWVDTSQIAFLFPASLNKQGIGKAMRQLPPYLIKQYLPVDFYRTHPAEFNALFSTAKEDEKLTREILKRGDFTLELTYRPTFRFYRGFTEEHQKLVFTEEEMQAIKAERQSRS